MTSPHPSVHDRSPSRTLAAMLCGSLVRAALIALGVSLAACHNNAPPSSPAAGEPASQPVAADRAAPAAIPPTPEGQPEFPAPQAHPSSAGESIKLYCSVDPAAAAPIIEKFRNITGIAVHAATAPDAADVCWTAEPCEVFELDAAGKLRAYHSESGDRHAGPGGWPSNFHAADNTWYALGRRLRVLAYNAAVTPADDLPRDWMAMTEPRWRGAVGIARPGPKDSTTGLQLAAMRAAHGSGFLRDWAAAIFANDARLFETDADVAAAVANGQVVLGMTSSDAAIHAAESGIPIRFRVLGDDGPIAAGKASGRVMEIDPGAMQVPQAVALTKAAAGPEAGAVFIDFLLSNEVALLQSMGASRLFGLSPTSVPGFAARCDGADGLGSRGTVLIGVESFPSNRVAEAAAAALSDWRAAKSPDRQLSGPDKR